MKEEDHAAVFGCPGRAIKAIRARVALNTLFHAEGSGSLESRCSRIVLFFKSRAMSDIRIVFCTCPDTDSASRIAEALVGERLAACVNILPAIDSVYRWQGAIERASEVQLIIKTVEARVDALTARIRALHPYELPEVVAIEAASGWPAYLDWVRAETTPES